MLKKTHVPQYSLHSDGRVCLQCRRPCFDLWSGKIPWRRLVTSLQWVMDTHSSIIAWRIPWTEEPGGLQSTMLQRVGHNCATNTYTHTKLNAILTTSILTLITIYRSENLSSSLNLINLIFSILSLKNWSRIQETFNPNWHGCLTDPLIWIMYHRTVAFAIMK